MARTKQTGRKNTAGIALRLSGEIPLPNAATMVRTDDDDDSRFSGGDEAPSLMAQASAKSKSNEHILPADVLEKAAATAKKAATAPKKKAAAKRKPTKKTEPRATMSKKLKSREGNESDAEEYDDLDDDERKPAHNKKLAHAKALKSQRTEKNLTKQKKAEMAGITSFKMLVPVQPFPATEDELDGLHGFTFTNNVRFEEELYNFEDLKCGISGKPLYKPNKSKQPRSRFHAGRDGSFSDSMILKCYYFATLAAKDWAEMSGMTKDDYVLKFFTDNFVFVFADELEKKFKEKKRPGEFAIYIADEFKGVDMILNTVFFSVGNYLTTEAASLNAIGMRVYPPPSHTAYCFNRNLQNFSPEHVLVEGELAVGENDDDIKVGGNLQTINAHYFGGNAKKVVVKPYDERGRPYLYENNEGTWKNIKWPDQDVETGHKLECGIYFVQEYHKHSHDVWVFVKYHNSKGMKARGCYPIYSVTRDFDPWKPLDSASYVIEKFIDVDGNEKKGAGTDEWAKRCSDIIRGSDYTVPGFHDEGHMLRMSFMRKGTGAKDKRFEYQFNGLAYLPTVFDGIMENSLNDEILMEYSLRMYSFVQRWGKTTGDKLTKVTAVIVA